MKKIGLLRKSIMPEMRKSSGFAQTIDLFLLERKERRDPPTFEEQLTDVTVFEGSTAKLRCEVKGKPTPKVDWLKNGEVNLREWSTEQKIQQSLSTISPSLLNLVSNRHTMTTLQP